MPGSAGINNSCGSKPAVIVMSACYSGQFVPVLARAAISAGVSGLFMETHPDPSRALSDGPNAWPLALMPDLLATLVELDRVVKRAGFAEQRLGI